MSAPLNSLSDDDVRQITLLVETLERSTFDFLQVQVGELKVTIGKGNPPAAEGAIATAATSPAAPPTPAPAAQASAAQAAPAHASAAAAAPARDGTVAVTSPMIGRFYAKPEPGAAPFVAVGTRVEADSTVALIEVMKVFTAVLAGVAGVITEVCVQDEQLVEYGHMLFRVRPD